MSSMVAPSRRDHALGGALGAVYVAWLLGTARSLGFPRDEGFYFRAAADYARWFRLLAHAPAKAFEPNAIDSMWSYNHEHPALMKSLFGLSWVAFHENLKVFADPSTAFRFPAMVMAGLSVYVTFLFGAQVYSRRAGVVAAVSLALMPHVFFHAHLACFDVPIMAMWTVCLYVYWRAVTPVPGRRTFARIAWPLAAGVVYGLTLETKHNAWVLPAVVLPHAFFVHRRPVLRGVAVGRLPVPLTLISMAVLGPLVFVACWPWMWKDTVPRVQEYLNFHLNHEYYNIEFLHRNYFGPPSPKLYAPLMIAATVPAVTLALFLAGVVSRGLHHVARLRSATPPPDAEGEGGGDRVRSDGEADLLFALAIGAALGPFFLPKTPIFGGTKHWLTAYPFLALFAGWGFERASRALASVVGEVVAKRGLKLPGKITAPALALGLAGTAAVLPPLVVTVHSHPFGLGAYTPLVGGTAGGADLGLYRSFWGYLTQTTAPYLAKLPAHSSVFIHDTAWDAWGRMQDEGRVRSDLRGVGTTGEGDSALVQYELHMLEVEYQEWITSGTRAPAYVLTHDGVPYVSAYEKRR